jgi:putative tryptophan/tyrosine transport system substrate-binding protein
MAMRRRNFIAGLASATAAWPLAASAQQFAMPVIGSLYGTSAAEWAAPMAGFRIGLSEAGFVEGRNVAIEYRWANGHFDRMRTMATDLVALKVAVMVVGGNLAGVRAALAATQSIPIVFTTASNPVDSGLVASLNHPHGNATGITLFAVELGPKKLELLREMMPTATKIALLVNPTNLDTLEPERQNLQAAADHLGMELVVLNAHTESEIEQAFATATQHGASALYVGTDAFLVSQRDHIAALGLRYALPTISPARSDVIAGELMSYGSSQTEMYRQAGIYVGRILKGEKPADLPVLQPTKFELVLNLKTARALGLTVPPRLLTIADEVIE